MTTTTVVLVAIVIAVITAALAWMYTERRRRAHLQSRFGPEYEHTVKRIGDPRRAEAELAQREKRVSSYHIRELNAEERDRFGASWRAVQAKFVDDPAAAVTEADLLVSEVMTTRGYPMNDFDRRADDLTVDHPNVVENYRQAREIARRHSRGEASTEDLRQAIVNYRALFSTLLEEHHPVRRSA
jgi:hypothetical protein